MKRSVVLSGKMRGKEEDGTNGARFASLLWHDLADS